ncbi:adenylate/guanylate cyclase domain-containing protein [Geminicoccus roseus]|uniref:adenylate/guanylate cyclase domain-containing protein n=1 Tax=Geminicoccus roseus TaxID=404900 RepID=UPI000404EB52|nr:adenylate/guanylate cyclase domain-containing protein [Geminicoccus roseus]
MTMPRLTLRWKLLLFAIAIAVLPILVAAQTMIRIGEDELKSSANEQLLGVATELTREINDMFERSWLGPLLLIRNAIDDERLGVEEKVALLTLGLSAIEDIAALQITLVGADLPLLVTKDDISGRLQDAGLEPVEVLRVAPARIQEIARSRDIAAPEVAFIPEIDDWLATIVLPLRAPLAGQDAILSARVDLGRLAQIIAGNPFARTGSITVVDDRGRQVLDRRRADLAHHAIVAEALELLSSTSRSLGVEPYQRPNGEVMLGAYAFPRPFRWAVLVERPEKDAYLAVAKMTRSLLWWGMVGFAVAVLGAVVLSIAISRPILEIDRVAVEVGRGNLAVRVVRGVRLNDEIGDLARRMNEMIVGLAERLKLERFVSGGTMAAVRLSQNETMELGGTRQRATMLFCDIRGYTSFAEQHEPAMVVEVLNFYFQHLAGLVRQHQGDIDKFVGDQILAVFTGDRAERRAVDCGLAMQAKMAELAIDRPNWNLAVGVGINSGEVIMGAMGSSERMDYTVLGDAVNVAARLCGTAGRGQTLISVATYQALEDVADLVVTPTTLRLKGKRKAALAYDVRKQVPPAPLAARMGAAVTL